VNNILQAALDLHDAGCSVIPARTDGSKAPIGSWKQYQVIRPTRDEVIEWFKDGHEGIGVITGSVSGNLEMLEAEGRAVHDGLFEQAKDLAFNSGLEDIWNILVSG
jgi:putative DNA primase/helicase